MDYMATTPMDLRVLREISYVSEHYYGNPNSLHKIGQNAKKIIEDSRKKIADLINANPDEIIFTSGATESNNLAIKGIIDYYKVYRKKYHIITSQTEHMCVKETCNYLENTENVRVTYLCPKNNGIIDLKELERAITKDTILISIMGVNNEIGAIQDLEAIGRIAKKHNIIFHTDCAQAFGKIPLDVKKMNIDLMSISGHKIYGPKGIGALYINKENRNILMNPILHGGGQEKGLRSGTLPVSTIAGFGKAAEIAKIEMNADAERILRLGIKLRDGILKINGVILNGPIDPKERYYGCLNFSFPEINGIELVKTLGDEIALSIGSACGSSHEVIDSYVIKSLNIGRNFSSGAVRFGIGKFTTEKEIDYVIQRITDIIKILKIKIDK